MWKMMASASSCLARLRFVVKVHLGRRWRRVEEGVEVHLASGQGEGVERREVKTLGHSWSPSCRGP